MVDHPPPDKMGEQALGVIKPLTLRSMALAA
jgi:hypothetical protein